MFAYVKVNCKEEYFRLLINLSSCSSSYFINMS